LNSIKGRNPQRKKNETHLIEHGLLKPVIRNATASDLGDILNLFVETVNHVCRKDYNDDQLRVWSGSAKNEQRWLHKIQSQYFIVAELKTGIVGFGSLEHGHYLDLLYIHKHYQGKGIAFSIYESLLKQAALYRPGRIQSEVSITARPFFEKLGFVVVSEQTQVIDSVPIKNFRMEKVL
jgi:putative acetyltransferase